MEKIGKYTITGKIGRGGFGQVYSALDSTVGRVVAVKVLNAPGDPSLVRRFRAEAKTVANLHHKNIVTVHEFGEEAGIPYLVMEFLDGTTLQEWIRRNSLTLLEKVEILSEVADGLQYAHERGVTHRDVKPGNIMRLADGAVKIMDFGIARIAAESSTRLTQAGFVVGSMDYMAPEQFNGTADAVSDIFAYGVTSYELLTGQKPFRASDPAAVVYQITNTDPPPVQSLMPDCPESLDQVLRRTLAKSRRDRYSSLSDVLDDVRPILLHLRRVRAEELYSDAKRLVVAGELEPAMAAVRKILHLDPMHAGARTLRAEIEQALHKRNLLVVSASLAERAEQELAGRRHDQAAGLLAGLQQLDLDDSDTQARLRQIEAGIERARRCARLLDEAREYLEQQDFTGAFRAVAEVLAIDPENSPGRSLFTEVRARIASRDAGGIHEADEEGSPRPTPKTSPSGQERRTALGEVVQEVRVLLEQKRAVEALALLRASIERYGDNAEIRKLAIVAEAQVREPRPSFQSPPQIQPEARAPVEIARNLWRNHQWLSLSAGVLLALAVLFLGLHSRSPRPPRSAAPATPSPMTAFLVLESNSAFDAVVGRSFSQPLRSPGYSQSLSWSILQGSLPPGLALSPQTGEIAGIPTVTGSFNFVVTVADTAGRTAQRAFTIRVTKPAAAPQPCQLTAFDFKQYGDSTSGVLVWTGSLSAGGRLDIPNGRATTGKLQGDRLPKGVPVHISVSPATIRKVLVPAAANCWASGFVLRNEGPAASEVRIAWEVVQK